jgi:transketolase
MPDDKLAQLAINTIRTLSIDAVEQASTFGWERYVGSNGCLVGMKTFGASAPLKELQHKFGFEPDQVAAVARKLLGR